MSAPPSIPPDQLERIQPILKQVLADLRIQAATLAPQDEPAVDYQVAR